MFEHRNSGENRRKRSEIFFENFFRIWFKSKKNSKLSHACVPLNPIFYGPCARFNLFTMVYFVTDAVPTFLQYSEGCGKSYRKHLDSRHWGTGSFHIHKSSYKLTYMVQTLLYTYIAIMFPFVSKSLVKVLGQYKGSYFLEVTSHLHILWLQICPFNSKVIG